MRLLLIVQHFEELLDEGVLVRLHLADHRAARLGQRNPLGPPVLGIRRTQRQPITLKPVHRLGHRARGLTQRIADVG